MQLLLFITLTCLCQRSGALMKQWHPPDSDWQNPHNWDSGRVPCFRSDAVLPDEVVISVFINGSAAWRSIVMPRTGELLLDDDWTMMVDEGAAGCHEGEVHFIDWSRGNWYEPQLWQLLDADGVPAPASASVPHSDRVPCSHDSVHLPDDRSLSLDFSGVSSITVGQLRYGQNLLTESQFLSKLSSPQWRYQIGHRPQTARFGGTECNDPLGCHCGHLHTTSVMQMVCSRAGALCRDQLQCDRALRPPGHCCQMCGATMKMKVNTTVFTLATLQRLVTSVVTDQSQVTAYAYRTDFDEIHLNVADDTTNQLSVQLAQRIHQYLVQDMTSDGLYGLVSLEMYQSGPSWRPANDEVMSTWSNIVVAVFAVVAVVTVMAYLYHLHSNNRLPRLSNDLSAHPAGFVRFLNDSGNVEIAVDSSFQQQISVDFDTAPELPQLPEVTPRSDIPEVPEVKKDLKSRLMKMRSSFANPLFGNPATSGRLSGRWTMSSLMKSNVATQENPIFDVPIPAPASFAFPSGLEERPIPEAGHQVPAEAAQLPQIIREESGHLETEAGDSTAEVVEEDDQSTSGSETKDIGQASAVTKKRKLKRMLKKAANKFIAAGSADLLAPPALQPEVESAMSASASPDEEIQLTLAEETHPED